MTTLTWQGLTHPHPVYSKMAAPLASVSDVTGSEMDFFEPFLYAIARLMIDEYEDDLAINEKGFFSQDGLITTELEDVERYFMEYWHKLLPKQEDVKKQERNTIGYCCHLMMLLKYDDEMQTNICTKIGEIFTTKLILLLEGDESDNMINVLYLCFNDVPASFSSDDDKCVVHTVPPIAFKYELFCRRFYGNFKIATTFKMKKKIYMQLFYHEQGSIETLKNYLLQLWPYLMPNIFQTKMMVASVYGDYPPMRQHIIHHDDGFRQKILNRVAKRVETFFLENKADFEPVSDDSVVIHSLDISVL